jgi:hypothetical protein
LLWGLLAPESESFCEDLRDLLMQGLLSPKKLALLEVSLQQQ